ncbi:hypothetical protein [Hungatella sp. SL.1.14]|uniref:hypothetical protein n=1 Tax=Hungatella sp. SL.1.14 TaxID=2963703 RepID=UPI0006C14F94|nr:hypothetical protein [Hungatella sp. SL.1.14]MCQ4830355.1 hypothetical protein [Hungatella sp. SL.1.14]CUQ52482.1 Uncharacterised protein [Hungatella hathewayi]
MSKMKAWITNHHKMPFQFLIFHYVNVESDLGFFGFFSFSLRRRVPGYPAMKFCIMPQKIDLIAVCGCLSGIDKRYREENILREPKCFPLGFQFRAVSPSGKMIL